ncbi:hypothetical protein [Rhizobium sp. BK176]|uniref:hypothetical protein n=1 Tax=Rhizobium sp. BK176 TaxID=2587071 RepID=UPI00216743C8|nr:hypothetical protein [Rhizobium sp. BK176]MCS4089865.1 hypothetical protein [Rhizobium sp. BK176]
MMHILYAVIAIALTCLVTFGGVSYIHSEAPVRAVASRALTGQYEAILLGVSSYRTENNGIAPQSIEAFSGFLPNGAVPSFGAPSQGFDWSMAKLDGEQSPALCLQVDTSQIAHFDSASMFARETLRRGNGRVTVTVGAACGEGQAFDGVSAPPAGGVVVFTIRGF